MGGESVICLIQEKTRGVLDSMSKKIFALVAMALVTLLLAGCNINLGGDSVRGVGEVVSRHRDVEQFNALSIEGNYVVVYRHAEESAITIVMQENLFEYFQVSVRGGTLYVDSSRNFNTTNANRPRIYVYTPYLEAANFRGAVSTTGWDVINTEQFSINTEGAVGITMQLEVEYLNVAVAGAGSLTLSGSSDIINITGEGAFNISAGDLRINGGRVNVYGVANVTLSTLENVEVSRTGLARVRSASE